jgi:CheY-like chemotaxis protein
LGDGVTLTLKLSPIVDLVRLDPAQFEAAILNLVVNARDAVGAGGTVTLETRRLFLSPAEAAPLPAADYVRISVADDGEGIPEDVLPRVFEPFFTTKDPGKGSGLGLSQVYGFAQEFGGQVKIDSMPARGTVVSLYLPRATSVDAVEPDQARSARRDSARPTGQSILVVDDDLEVLDVAVENLSDLGYRVCAARDGSEALQMLRGSEKIDLLLTDVVMPGAVNGEQLAREAQILRPGLKVLLTSGYPSAVLARHVDRPGDLEILGKPYRRDDLATTLRRVLDGV